MAVIVSGNSLGLDLSSLAVLGQRPAFGEASQGRSGERLYVNASTGNLVLQTRDEFLAAPGDDLVSVRTYNSQGVLDDDNADNWLQGPARLQVDLGAALAGAGGTLVHIGADGSRGVYQYDASRAAYVCTDGAGAYDTIV